MSKSIEKQSEEQFEEGPDFYEVEEILNKKQTLTGTMYLIKWKDYPNPSDYTWEPLQHLNQVMHLVDQFNQKRDSLKKKIKKQYRQRVFKGAKNKESSMQVDSSPQNRILQVNQISSSEKATKKKEKAKKEKCLPKVVDIKVDKKKNSFEKKYSQNSPSHSLKQKQRHETSKYLLPVTPNKQKDQITIIQKYQDIQIQHKYWFNTEPYKVGAIIRHVVENGKVFYLCDVDTKNGELFCIVKLSQNQAQAIYKEQQKKFILQRLFDVQKQMNITPENQQFEKSWKTCN